MRLIDSRFVTKTDDGSIVATDLTNVGEEEVAEFGVVIDTLIGLGSGPTCHLMPLESNHERLHGLGPDELTALVWDAKPGDADAISNAAMLDAVAAVAAADDAVALNSCLVRSPLVDRRPVRHSFGGRGRVTLR